MFGILLRTMAVSNYRSKNQIKQLSRIKKKIILGELCSS
jgi:hypothetical protein